MHLRQWTSTNREIGNHGSPAIAEEIQKQKMLPSAKRTACGFRNFASTATHLAGIVRCPLRQFVKAIAAFSAVLRLSHALQHHTTALHIPQQHLWNALPSSCLPSRTFHTRYRRCISPKSCASRPSCSLSLVAARRSATALALSPSLALRSFSPCPMAIPANFSC